MAGSASNVVDTPKQLPEEHLGKAICVQCDAAIFNVFFHSGYASFNIVSDHFPRISQFYADPRRPTRAVCCTLFSAYPAYWTLIGGCNPMVCPILV